MKMSSEKFTEKSLVEDYILEKLIERSWRFMPTDKNELNIPLPPLPEQRRIAEILSAADGRKRVKVTGYEYGN